jgi:hypothetical protein
MAYEWGSGNPSTLQVGDNALLTVVPKRTISKSRNAPPCLLCFWARAAAVRTNDSRPTRRALPSGSI